MNAQEVFDSMIRSDREERMKTSSQLMLGELILKLEAIGNKDLPVIFDNGKYCPTDLDSWRGSYAELALEYQYTEGEELTLAAFLKMLKEAIGKTYNGYKGGDFIMGKNTPIWVAHYGTSIGFKENEDGDYQAVVDTLEKEGCVVIVTELLEY